MIMRNSDASILLVEDDANDAALIERAFRKSNIANPIQVVSDGDAAVEYLRGDGEYADRKRFPRPVLVLLDLKLPRRSGLEVLEWIRDQEGLKRLPVVVLTSSRQRSDIDAAYDLGANSYLVKPIAFADLQATIQAVGTFWLRHSEAPAVWADSRTGRERDG